MTKKKRARREAREAQEPRSPEPGPLWLVPGPDHRELEPNFSPDELAAELEEALLLPPPNAPPIVYSFGFVDLPDTVNLLWQVDDDGEKFLPIFSSVERMARGRQALGAGYRARARLERKHGRRPRVLVMGWRVASESCLRMGADYMGLDIPDGGDGSGYRTFYPSVLVGAGAV